ncbi:MerR family transcriptional regulator [Nocardia callitridis]|uniref:MerR family transcriptional regulator n=1 Tax=Nocardia callitridis TaxID=648753 RepID=A0ABP9JRV2_9NOCA
MAWSTRQLADLAGTTLRAVRHYHEVGLLAEPERSSNGYKQYGVAHLVRLLRIKRLSDLGFSLSQIAAMGEADEHPEEAVAVLDAELAATIERLQRVRVELSTVLGKRSPTDLPPELSTAVADLPANDRAFTVVLSRIFGPKSLETWRKMMEDYHYTPNAIEFDKLTDDTDDATRQRIAQALTTELADLTATYPEAAQLGMDAPSGVAFANEAMNVALLDLYNEAQIDVTQRVVRLISESKKS